MPPTPISRNSIWSGGRFASPFRRFLISDTIPIACRPAVQFNPFYPAGPISWSRICSARGSPDKTLFRALGWLRRCARFMCRPVWPAGAPESGRSGGIGPAPSSGSVTWCRTWCTFIALGVVRRSTAQMPCVRSKACRRHSRRLAECERPLRNSEFRNPGDTILNSRP